MRASPREAAARPQPGDLRPEPLPAIDDIDGAIRHALDNPIDAEPLRALLFPGMKLTIAFDDVSLPLPKMRRPDVRQRVIEAVSTSPPRPASTTSTSSPPSPCTAG